MRPLLVVQLGNDALFSGTKNRACEVVSSHHFGDTLKNGYSLRTSTDAQAVDWVS
jgi:hypothetical protein